MDPARALDPPELLTEVHTLLADLLARQLTAAEELLPVAAAADSRSQLVGTPEFTEYEASNANGFQVCIDL